ncbi:MAG: hypothetical protein SGILL_005257, partial [Bacillariaceae sp.]
STGAKEDVEMTDTPKSPSSKRSAKKKTPTAEEEPATPARRKTRSASTDDIDLEDGSAIESPKNKRSSSSKKEKTKKSSSSKKEKAKKASEEEAPLTPTRRRTRSASTDEMDFEELDMEAVVSPKKRSSSKKDKSSSKSSSGSSKKKEAAAVEEQPEASTPTTRRRTRSLSNDDIDLEETPKVTSSKKDRSSRKSSSKKKAKKTDEEDAVEMQVDEPLAEDVPPEDDEKEEIVEKTPKKPKSSKKVKSSEKKKSTTKKARSNSVDAAERAPESDGDAVDPAETPKSNKKQKTNDTAASSSTKQANDGETKERPVDKDGKPIYKPGPPKLLDVHIHRLRHLQYHPTAVTAMAATNKDGYVAIARQDGSFQLKVLGVLQEYRNRYISHLTTVAEIPPPIQETPALVPTSMCWVENSDDAAPLCIAAGPSGNLWTIDWEHSEMTSIVQSGGGGVFDLVTCQNSNTDDDNASASSSLPFVAAACQDGSVRIWKVGNGSSGDEDLAVSGNATKQSNISDPPLCTVPSMGSPILSLAWRLVSQKEQKKSGSSVKSTVLQTVLFAAVADGTIRKYQVDIIRSDYRESSTKQASQYEYKVGKIKSMTRMTVESKGRRTATKVWSLRLLSDGTLIAGNSLGQVQFWNSQTGTLQQTVLQSSLQADVLKIVATADESKVFCSGVDSRVVCIARSGTAADGGTASPWKLVAVQRPHSHDVKAMVLLPGETFENASQDYSMPRRLETLISGGVDTKVCSYMVGAFGEKRPQQWYPWPMQSPISTSSNSKAPKILSMQRRDRIELYELDQIPDNTPDPLASKTDKELVLMGPQRIPLQKSQETSLLATIQLDKTSGGASSRLLASQLSSNGKFLAVSNGTSVLVFYLDRVEDKDGDEEIQPIKMQLPEGLQNVNATALSFWGNLLFVADSRKREIHTVLLRWDRDTNSGVPPGELKYARMTVPDVQHGIKGEVRLPIQSIECNVNGKMLVVLSHARDGGVNVYQRKTADGEYRHEWTIPKLGGYDARPAAATFILKDKLAVATYQSHVYVFNVFKKKLSSWSEKHGFPVRSQSWTEDLLCRKDYPVRLMANPKNRGQLIIVSVPLKSLGARPYLFPS